METFKKGVDYPGVTVCFFCHDGNGNVLLNFRSTQCRDEHHRWDIGAGGLDLGDTVEGTLRKEIKEEYGCDVLVFEFMGYRDLHREHDGKKTHWVGLDFKVQIDPAQVVNGEPHKFEKLEWFPIDNLPSPMHSQFPIFWEKNKKFLLS
jgi:8-oxo-dGTP pyrophosphatase MutT (NUDIX family)